MVLEILFVLISISMEQWNNAGRTERRKKELDLELLWVYCIISRFIMML